MAHASPSGSRSTSTTRPARCATAAGAPPCSRKGSTGRARACSECWQCSTVTTSPRPSSSLASARCSTRRGACLRPANRHRRAVSGVRSCFLHDCPSVRIRDPIGGHRCKKQDLTPAAPAARLIRDVRCLVRAPLRAPRRSASRSGAHRQVGSGPARCDRRAHSPSTSSMTSAVRSDVFSSP